MKYETGVTYQIEIFEILKRVLEENQLYYSSQHIDPQQKKEDPPEKK
jgi:hypothetical protein